MIALVVEPHIVLLEDVISDTVTGTLFFGAEDGADVGAEGGGFIMSSGAGWEMTFVLSVELVAVLVPSSH